MTTTRNDLDGDPVLDDSRAGLAMFLIFSAAVLIVTGAVALVALVGTWWMLGVGFAVHVLLTILVMGTIWYVMQGRTGEPTEGQPAEDLRLDHGSPTPPMPVAAI